jgi:hypothetical protein
MNRRTLYIQVTAAAFSAVPAEHRRAAWRELEEQFTTEYRRTHPGAPAEQINTEFLGLARAISSRMASPERRPIPRMPAQ